MSTIFKTPRKKFCAIANRLLVNLCYKWNTLNRDVLSLKLFRAYKQESIIFELENIFVR